MDSEAERILENKNIKPTAMRILVLKELLLQSDAVSLYDIPIPSFQLPNNFEFKTANFVIKGICPHCHK